MNREKPYASAEYREREREARAIRKDIATAQAIIEDGILRYKKKMLRVRSKKQVDDPSLFAPLEIYASRQEIQDAYGWDIISESETDKLNALWDVRAEYFTARGKFEDRVTRFLEHAISECGGEYDETLQDFDEQERRVSDDKARIERENRDNDYKRHHADS